MLSPSGLSLHPSGTPSTTRRARGPGSAAAQTTPGRSARGLLQELDAAPVVLDQIIVGGEDNGNWFLLAKRRQWQLEPLQDLKIDVGDA